MYNFSNLFNLPNIANISNMSGTENIQKDTHYITLGISNIASQDEIKKAYRKLSLKYHPDRNNNNKEKCEIYKKITEAYNILSNETERKKYDFSLNNHLGLDIDPAFFMNMIFNPMEAKTIFNEMKNGNFTNLPLGKNIFPDSFGPIAFGNIPLSSLNNNNSINNDFTKYGYNSKPPTIYQTINIKLLEAYKGCKIPLSIIRWNLEDNIKHEQTETIYVTIPKGIDNDEIIIIPNKGNCISNTNKGNIEIKIIINNNTAFKRKGIDLIFKKSITLKESFCGFSFDLPYIDGREFKINNEAGNVIPPDFRKIIQNLGMERDGDKGNLIIIFDVIYPKQLSSNLIDKLKEIL